MCKVTESYLKIYRLFAYSTAFVTCYSKGSIADGITQVTLETSKNISNTPSEITQANSVDTRSASGYVNDESDNWRFAMYFSLYCACIQHLPLPTLIPTLLMKAAILKTFIDAIVHAPFLYFPVYFALKSTFLGSTPMDGLKQYWCEKKWNVLIPFTKKGKGPASSLTLKAEYQTNNGTKTMLDTMAACHVWCLLSCTI